MDLLLSNIAAALAATIQSAAGIGFSMVAVPLLALIDITLIPAPVLVANLMLATALVVRLKAAVDRRELAPLGVGLSTGTVAGVAILTILGGDGLGLAIGGLVLVAVILSVFAPSLPLTRPVLGIGAVFSGITGVLAAMHAPPLAPLYNREPPAKVRATFAVVFVFGCGLALFLMWVAGELGREQILSGLLMAPGLLIGLWIGDRLARIISPGMARAAMLSLSGAAAVSLILRSL